jgi:hypothetical protein
MYSCMVVGSAPSYTLPPVTTHALHHPVDPIMTCRSAAQGASPITANSLRSLLLPADRSSKPTLECGLSKREVYAKVSVCIS